MVVCVGEAVAVGRLLAARALSLATGRDVRKGEGAMGAEAEPPLFFSNGCSDEEALRLAPFSSCPSTSHSFGGGAVSAAAFPTASAAQHAAPRRSSPRRLPSSTCQQLGSSKTNNSNA